MFFTAFIRSIVKKHPELELKLKKSMSRKTPFQYIFQTLTMTLMSFGVVAMIVFFATKSNPLHMVIGLAASLFFFTPLLYRFWFSYVDVEIRKRAREQDGDLLFVSEYFLVSLESGLPLGNAIRNISKLERPGGLFFKKVYTEFKTGKDLEQAIDDAIGYSASDNLKVLLKRLKDSLNIGVDLRVVLVNFIQESSEKKIIEIKSFSKKLSPVIMMYLILGIVMPSLGITFFILAAALIDITPEFLKIILVFVFLIMFAFQYFAYTSFKFSKSTL